MAQEGTRGNMPKLRRALDRSSQILLADVARSYYVDGQSKVDIAAKFAISRFQVAKMLEDARAFGVVSIEVRDPRNPPANQAAELAAALGIDRVDIVEPAELTTNKVGTYAERVGICVMQLLREMVRPGMTVGISWSRTLDAASRFLPDLPNCNIVQLAGALQVDGAGFIPRMMTQIGENPDIQTHPISAPLVVDEPSTARDLMRQPEIAEVLAMADKLDIALVAIGAWKPNESTVWQKVGQADRDDGTNAGAVAEISGRLVGADGQSVQTALDSRTISVTLTQLANAGKVIGVAHGIARVDAVIAAVRGRFITCLVVDGALADAVIARLKEAQ